VKLLTEEYLHTSLVEPPNAAGHVDYLGLGSSKDWQLMATIRVQDYAFVTNNRCDFLAPHGQEPLHPGVIVVVLNDMYGCAAVDVGTTWERGGWDEGACSPSKGSLGPRQAQSFFGENEGRHSRRFASASD
jgi:hypothetical protein